jgi:hypothetical protein
LLFFFSLITRGLRVKQHSDAYNTNNPTSGKGEGRKRNPE